MQGDLEATEWVDVAIATHYFDRPQSSLVAMEKPSAFTKQMAFSKHWKVSSKDAEGLIFTYKLFGK